MSIHPSPSSPLLPSDQADVIRLYLELMDQRNCVEQRDHAEYAPEAIKIPKTFRPFSHSDESFFPSDTFDYE